MEPETDPPAETAPSVRLDAIGIFWIMLASVWTVLLVSGMAFLITKRHMPTLKMRGLGVSLGAIVCLHLYWISVQIGYAVGPLAPGHVEYWIMGTWYPFGVALFHASNSRFLHVAKAQRRFIHANESEKELLPKKRPRWGSVRKLDYSTRILLSVALGMLFQLLTTVLMYLISRKWHPSWGIPGTEVHGTPQEQIKEMGRGWEWWPSVFWQIFWAWVVAPIILWKARRIHDTQGWRLQTIACCIASLPGAPMWLVALYVPAMEPVNMYFIPPQWLCISIAMIEVFTIFLPCWEVIRHQHLQQETLDSIAQWEAKNRLATNGARSLNSGSTVVESIMTGWKSTEGSVKSASNQSILTMSALEHVLERNPEPLLKFSALRDFSGENVAFLTHVAAWKALYSRVTHRSRTSLRDQDPQQGLPELFASALRIYISFISTRDAEFQINISSQALKKLEIMFEASARVACGEKDNSDAASPFLESPGSLSDGILSARPTSTPHDDGSMGSQVDLTMSGIQIPAGFGKTVFDEAEESIKYLVLTNTWPKFVKEKRSSMESCDSVESGVFGREAGVRY